MSTNMTRTSASLVSREMKIKASDSSSHSHSVGKTNCQYQVLVRIQSTRISHTVLVGMYVGATTVGKSGII